MAAKPTDELPAAGEPPEADAPSAEPPEETPASAEAPAPPGRRRARGGAGRVVAVAVASRLFIFAVAFVAAASLGIMKLPIGWRFPARAEVFHGLLGSLVNPWAHWDGVWYVKIATSGYADGDGSTAFFPLFPLLLRYGSVLLRGNMVLTGIIISLLCYAGCVWLLFRLVRADFDDSLALRAVTYLSIGPLAFFLQAVYTESLFLFLSLACFVFAREGRLRLAGVMGLLATLTRSTGVLLLIPMAYYYYDARDWKFGRTDSHVANLLMVLEGLLVWMTYLSLSFGKPLLFSTAQSAWRRSLAAPSYAMAVGIVAGVKGAGRLLGAAATFLVTGQGPTWSKLGPSVPNLINLLFLAGACLLLWYGARRLPRAYSWYALAALAYPLLFPAFGVPLLSYPRFTLTVFPLYVALALFTRRRPRLHVAVIVTSLILLTLLTAKFAVFSWVA